MQDLAKKECSALQQRNPEDSHSATEPLEEEETRNDQAVEKVP
jgi:hypothetical protein